jgi:osmotically-inducible protein OsmY
MKTDIQIQQDVRQALQWDPSISQELIGVTVAGGVVTLFGNVPSYFEKGEAEVVAQRVGGVKAVIERINVKLSDSFLRDDSDIAKAILSQFTWSYNVPEDLIKIKVENGWVRLSGEVEWEFQRSAAANCIKDLLGVTGVSNEITLKTKHADIATIKAKIEEALKTESKNEAQRIHVNVSGGEVTLTGDVQSFAEMDDAKWAAWGAPGVTKVESRLHLSSF